MNQTTKRKQKVLGPTRIPKKYTIDYKYIALLKCFINKYGKIRPRRITKLPLKQQRQIAKAIKKARALGLIPCSINYLAQ